MKSLLSSLFGAVALSAVAVVPTEAALLVNWGGNYVTANQAYSNPNTSPATQYGGFFEGEARQLSPSTGYSGTSSLFYGQVVRNSGSGTL